MLCSDYHHNTDIDFDGELMILVDKAQIEIQLLTLWELLLYLFPMPLYTDTCREWKWTKIDSKVALADLVYCRCPKRYRFQIQPASDLKSQLSVSLQCQFRCLPSFHRFRGDFGCDFAGALRFQIAAIWNHCDSDLRFGHLSTQSDPRWRKIDLNATRDPMFESFFYLGGGDSALVIGFSSRPISGPQKHFI